MNAYTLPNPRPLETSIAKKLDKNFRDNTEWRQFSNGEWYLRVIKKSTAALVLGRTEPPGDQLVQTLTLLDTVKRNGAKSITLVLPYFGYSRQDRVVRSGDHLPADLFLKLFKACGVSHIVTVDLHSTRTEKNAPLPLITTGLTHEFTHEFTHELRALQGNFTIVAPDHGARQRADRLCNLLDTRAPVCWLKKTRDPKTGRVHSGELFGVKKGTTAVIVDDILDTGDTIKECVITLKREGFKTFTLAVTHPIFSARAVHTLRALKFKRIFVSNTIPLAPQAKNALPIIVIDAAPCILRAIRGRKGVGHRFASQNSKLSQTPLTLTSRE